MFLTLRLLAFVALFGLAAWGWGRAFRAFHDRRALRVHALTAVLGLATMNVVGGVLSLLHLATQPVLLAMIGGGLIVALFELRRLRPRGPVRLEARHLALLLALAVPTVVAHLLAPGGVFNIHDDFHTYATRAVRQAQTGAVAGNPFDPLGLDSLGSQSLFHAVFLQGHDISLLNGFDAVACFALFLLLVAELCLRWRLPAWFGAALVLAAAAINPQYVNISPLYSGAVAILGLVVTGAWWARSLARRQPAAARRAGLAVALLAGWLVTLKITLAAFAGLFLAGLTLLVLARTRPCLPVLRGATRTALLIGLFVLPWALLCLFPLLAAREAAAELAPAATLAARHAVITERNLGALLQPGPLWYGNATVHFVALALAGAALGALSLRRLGTTRTSAPGMPLAAVFAAGVVLPLLLALHAHLFPIASAVRYSCPILLGAFAATALVFARFGTPRAGRNRREDALVTTLVCAGFIVAFGPHAWERFERAANDHTLLAYRLNRHFTAYSRAMTAPGESVYAAGLQQALPAGATALVWTVAPFHFDFARNRLLTASESGVSNPALRFPAGASPEEFNRYLRQLGVRHVILETNAYGIKEPDELAALSRSRHAVERKLGDYGAYLRSTLTTLAGRNHVRYADDRMVIYDLAEPESPVLTHVPPQP